MNYNEIEIMTFNEFESFEMDRKKGMTQREIYNEWREYVETCNDLNKVDVYEYAYIRSTNS